MYAHYLVVIFSRVRDVVHLQIPDKKCPVSTPLFPKWFEKEVIVLRVLACVPQSALAFWWERVALQVGVPAYRDLGC